MTQNILQKFTNLSNLFFRNLNGKMIEIEQTLVDYTILHK